MFMLDLESILFLERYALNHWIAILIQKEHTEHIESINTLVSKVFVYWHLDSFSDYCGCQNWITLIIYHFSGINDASCPCLPLKTLYYLHPKHKKLLTRGFLSCLYNNKVQSNE